MEILRELYPDAEHRPKELQDAICPRTGMSKGNIFAGLDSLQELNLVKRLEGEGRAVLYSLTDRGREMAELIDVTEPAKDADNANTSEQQSNRDGDADLAAIGGLHNPENELAFEKVTATTDRNIPSLAEVDSTGTPDPERVEQLKQQLDQYLRRTNVSLPELVAAVNELVAIDTSHLDNEMRREK